MKKLVSLFFAFALALMALESRADVLLLAHGYLSNASTWEGSGVSTILAQKGWQRGGVLRAEPRGVQLWPARSNQAQATKNRQFLAELPSTVPLGIQANHLQSMVWYLAKRFPQEKIVLVGHSVGGVVARLVVVRSNIPKIAALITIATPHLGTPLAEDALDATSSPWPIEVLKDVFGGSGYQTLKYSRGLYIDLVQPRPGSLLFWLNGQRHPNINYVSVIRAAPFILWGDMLVPGVSQDMNNVPALAGRSSRFATASGHGLNPGDGQLLVDILQRM